MIERTSLKEINSLLDNGKRIVFVLEGPNFPVSVQNYLSKATFLNLEIDPDLISVDVKEQRMAIGILPSFLNSIDGALYVDIISLFCGITKCNGIMTDGNPLVVDDQHISHFASKILAIEVFGLLGY
mgnify:FL=1